MTGKRGVRPCGQCRVEWTTGPSNLLRDGRVMKFECEVGLADTEPGAVWLLARLLSSEQPASIPLEWRAASSAFFMRRFLMPSRRLGIRVVENRIRRSY